MIKDLLARFKKVFTVAEWKREAQDAIRKKEFVVASLSELHRVEKAEGGIAREQVQSRQQTSKPRTTQQQNKTINAPINGARTFAESSLKELMDSVRRQQTN